MDMEWNGWNGKNGTACSSAVGRGEQREMQQGFRAGRELGKTAGTEVFGAQGHSRNGELQGFRTAREKILNGEGRREERGTLVAGFLSDDCRSWC